MGSSSCSSSSSSSSSSRYSSSSDSMGHLFGPPKEHHYSSSSSSSSSYSTGSTFGSIFPPPSAVLGRDSSPSGAFTGYSRSQDLGNQFGIWNNYGDHQGQVFKGESKGRSSTTSYNQQETAEPCYMSSSIYYGGQENYSPRTQASESQHTLKKDGEDDDSGSASRGNWWRGSLYY
ncbi:hypothetical protein CRG98_032961 [Punica granatum]|nr:hypothetical protein CRG98_032961 [Punica granatum]